MTSDAPEKSKEKKKPGLFKRIWDAPKNWSAVTRATVLLVVFLVVTVVGCWLTFLFGVAHVPWHHYMTVPRLLGLCGLLVAIPAVFHKGMRLWLEGDAARFPELEKAWHAGLQALRNQGITLDSAPLFLVTGSSCEQQERAIMNANSSPLSVVGVPKGPAPLHWYANSEAIFLFCSDTSWLSALSRLHKVTAEESSSTDAMLHGFSEVTPVEGASFAASEPRPAAAPTASAAQSVRGTIVLDQFVGGASDDVGHQPSSSISSTMTIDQPVPKQQTAATPPARSNPSPRQSRRPAVTMPSRESAAQLQGLQNVCQLVRNARQPYCAVNGVLTLLPFAAMEAVGDEMEEFCRAIRADLAVMHGEFHLRTPVTAMIVGLEDESGFRELVRRVGRERSATQRFGSRYDIRAEATTDNLGKFSAHVCGAFEDWIYTLFREQGALSRPGNPRLYGLLCKVRCMLSVRLSRILCKGYGVDDRNEDDQDSLLFSGCYFASTGKTPDRQAFLQGILSKLVSEQEQTEWTDRAIASETRFRKMFLAGLAVNGVLLAALATLMII